MKMEDEKNIKEDMKKLDNERWRKRSWIIMFSQYRKRRFRQDIFETIPVVVYAPNYEAAVTEATRLKENELNPSYMLSYIGREYVKRERK